MTRISGTNFDKAGQHPAVTCNAEQDKKNRTLLPNWLSNFSNLKPATQEQMASSKKFFDYINKFGI